MQLIVLCPTSIHVPQEACIITTPLLSAEWRSLLAEHHYPELVQFCTTGISNGFRIGFSPPQSHTKQVQKNMQSAYAHKEVVDSYLQTEVTAARVAGPFAHLVVQKGQISRF